MFQYLLLIPVCTSLILGVAYLAFGDARPGFKMAGTALFCLAAYLQFIAGFPLFGLLVQTSLAFYLAVWHRMGRQAR